jgi:hypothetical protein
MSRPCFALCIPAAVGALVGCAPLTQYRYSANVPAVRPIPWDGRTPPSGSLSFDGSITHAGVMEHLFPQPHDTAVLVPEWTAEGSALVAVSSRFQLGVRAAYSAPEWAQPSAAGTMPVPNSPGSWGLGPEMRASFPLDGERRFALGIAANVLSYQMPYAEWTLTGPQSMSGQPLCVPSPTCVSNYSLYDTRSESHLVYSLGIYPSYALGDRGQYGALVGLVGATNGFKNDGFTDQPSNGSTLDTVGPIVELGAGYGVHHDAFRAMGLVYWPLTDYGSPVEYGPSVQLALGVDLDVMPRAARGDD